MRYFVCEMALNGLEVASIIDWFYSLTEAVSCLNQCQRPSVDIVCGSSLPAGKNMGRFCNW